VLRLAKVRPGGHDYYLQVAAGTGTGAEPAGWWVGSGSTALGLRGEVGAAELAAVLAGRHPAAGTVLGGARERVAVAGFDLTFCAPKSVSLLGALGEPEAAASVADAHRQAVAAAVGYLERQAAAVRRRVGAARRVPVPCAGLVAASFEHHVSRALDPHLHTHVVTANLAADADGRWSALDGRGLYAHRAAADALYHAHLRHELSASLGVAWEPARRGRADLAGIGPGVRLAFSQRALAVAAYLTDRGGGRRAAELAAHATRPARDPWLGPRQLDASWRHRAQAVGLTPARLAAVLDRRPRRELAGQVPSGGAQAGWASAGWPHASRERAGWEQQAASVALSLVAAGRPVARRDAVRAWSWAAAQGAPAPWLEASVDRLVALLDPGHGAGRHVPGVGERRYPVERLAELARQAGVALERTAVAPWPGRDHVSGHRAERALDTGLGLG